MKKTIKSLSKGLGLILMALLLVVGVGAGSASATLTVAALSATSDGALTLSSSSITSAVTIGTSTMTTGATTVYGGTGTGAITLTPGTAGTIVIGAAAGTGAITLGSSTAAQTVNIGNGVPAANQTVNIMSGAAATAGVGSLLMGNSDRITTIDLGNVAPDAARTTTIAGGGAGFVDLVAIGTGAATVAGGKTINIGTTDPTGSGTNLVTIGSNGAFASTTTIRGGNAGTAISIQPNVAGTILIGTTNTSGAITIGSGTTTTVSVTDDNWGVTAAGVGTLVSLATTGQGALAVGPFGSSAGNTGEARFLELVAGGTNYVGVKAPDAITTNVVWTLPSADGTNGQFLSTNASGVLSWATSAGNLSGANTWTTTNTFTPATDVSGIALVGTNVATGTLQSIVGNGLTTGIGESITSSAAAITGAGRLLSVDHTGTTSSTGTIVEFKTAATDAVNATTLLKLTQGANIVGVGLSVASTTGLTTGSLIRATTSTAGALATNGAISFRGTGAFTSTANAGLLDVQADALVGTGTVVNIKATNASQATNTLLNVEQTTATTGYTGNIAQITGTSTTGNANVVLITSANSTDGNALKVISGVTTTNGSAVLIQANALTTGVGLRFAHTSGSNIVDGGSMVRLSSAGVDTGGATNGTILDVKSTAQLAGTIARFDNILTTGTGVSIIGTGILTGAGNLLTVTGNSGTDTAGIVRINGTALTSGTGLLVTGSAIATMTAAGSYIRATDGTTDVFRVSANGHLISAAADVAGGEPLLTVDTGWTATAETGGNGVGTATDTRGRVAFSADTDGGFANIAFGTAYATAPVCVISPANIAAQANVDFAYVTTAADAFRINYITGTAGTADIWNYICIE